MLVATDWLKVKLFGRCVNDVSPLLCPTDEVSVILSGIRQLAALGIVDSEGGVTHLLSF